MRTPQKWKTEQARQATSAVGQGQPLPQPSASSEAAVGGYPPNNTNGPLAKAFVLVGIGIAALYALRRYQRR